MILEENARSRSSRSSVETVFVLSSAVDGESVSHRGIQFADL